MGLMGKIEDKLSGNSSSNTNEASQLDRQDGQNVTSGTNQDSTSSGNSLKHPIGSGSGGSGITGGTALGSQGTSAQGGSTSGYDNNSSLSNKMRDTHLGSGNQNTTSSSEYGTARQPYDPYSSKGQQIAANAADNRGQTTQAGNYDDNVQRSSAGGVTNSLHSGSTSNRDGTSTAGGRSGGVPGAYDSYDAPSGQTGSQHHYGRDAAGAGALGAGAYEVEKHHGRHGQHGTTSDASNSRYEQPSSTSGGYGGANPSSSSTIGGNTNQGQNVSYMNRPSANEPLSQSSDFAQSHPSAASSGNTSGQHHYGRDAALAGGAGAVGAEAEHRHNKHGHSKHGHNNRDNRDYQDRGYSGNQGNYGSNQGTYGNQGNYGSQGNSGAGNASANISKLTLARKLGAAYEAGYRDALEHARQESEGY